MVQATTKLADVRALFSPGPGLTYLDAATYGLPTRPTVAALQKALSRWQSGEANFESEWEPTAEVSRRHFAALIGGNPDEIALIPTASAGVGLVAAGVPSGGEVVVPDDEFTSVLFPLLVAAERHGVRVRRVPFGDLAESIGAGTDLAAFSLTRSQDGESASLADVVSAARQHGAQLLVDATHSVPFVPIQPWLADIDYLVCHGYKHLLCPRGVAFMHVRKDRWRDLPPWFANWRASDPRALRDYGGTLDDLAANARRFDLSLAWHSWVGAEPTLQLLVQWQEAGVLEEVRRLAQRLALGLGRPQPSGSIVSVRVEDADAAARSLDAMGIRCAARSGNIRLSPHVYNDEADVDRAVEALARFIA